MWLAKKREALELVEVWDGGDVLRGFALKEADGWHTYRLRDGECRKSTEVPHDTARWAVADTFGPEAAAAVIAMCAEDY